MDPFLLFIAQRLRILLLFVSGNLRIQSDMFRPGGSNHSPNIWSHSRLSDVIPDGNWYPASHDALQELETKFTQ
jgi:hypothetical protein